MPARIRDRVLIVLILVSVLAPTARSGEIPAVLGLKEQAAVYDAWLTKRLDKLLPEIMRREKIDMWLVICEEYNEDPVYLTLVRSPVMSFLCCCSPGALSQEIKDSMGR